MDTAPAEWSELLASDPNATPSHRPALWQALMATTPNLSLRFIAVRSGDALAGGAPFILERRAGFHWIHGLPRVLPGSPLAAAGAHAAVDAAVSGALAALQREIQAVGGEWSLYRPCGPPVEAGALEMASGETRTLDVAVVDLTTGLEAARARMDRKARHEVGQARRRGLHFAEEPGALETCYALHVSQSRRWPGAAPASLELSRRLIEPSGGEAAGARLFTVRDDRGVLCGALVLDHPRELLLWWTGSHPEARTRNAPTLLLWSIAEWGIANGRARLNLGASPGLAGVAAFKASLGAHTVTHPVRWLDATHAPPIGRALAAVQARWRRRRFRGELA